MTVLKLDGVCIAPWGSSLLENINVSLEAGEILGIIGPNGAGKSSLLDTIAGDTPLQSGQLRLNGAPLQAWDILDLARSLAYLPQQSRLNFPFTVEEVILLGRSPHNTGATRDREILEEVLQLTDIAHLRDRLYTRLSGGEKQRVQLARIFTQIWQRDSFRGKLLLLDEPTAALDIQHQLGVAAAIKELAEKGCAVVLVVHDFNTIATVADQIITLHKGRQFATGKPGEVLTEKLFKEVFSADVAIAAHPSRDQPLVVPR